MSDTVGSFTFDGVNQIISIGQGVSSVTAGDMYSSWKQWAQRSDNAKFKPAFGQSVGGEPIGNSVYVGSYYFIQNGWVVRPQEADHTLILSGNLYPIPDNAGIFTATLGNHTVIIGMRTSSLTQRVIQTVDSNGNSTGGNTGTGATAAEIADAVWEKDLSTVASGAGKDLSKVKTNANLIPALM